LSRSRPDNGGGRVVVALHCNTPEGWLTCSRATRFIERKPDGRGSEYLGEAAKNDVHRQMGHARKLKSGGVDVFVAFPKQKILIMQARGQSKGDYAANRLSRKNSPGGPFPRALLPGIGAVRPFALFQGRLRPFRLGELAVRAQFRATISLRAKSRPG